MRLVGVSFRHRTTSNSLDIIVREIGSRHVVTLISFFLCRLHQYEVQGMILINGCIVIYLIFYQPVEVESGRAVSYGIGLRVIILLSQQRQLRRAIRIVVRTVIIPAERNVIGQSFKELYFRKYLSDNRHAVHNIRLQVCHCNGVQYGVMLIIVPDSPVTVSLIIIASVGIIHRPYGRHHQCRLYNATCSRCIYTIGS